MSALSQALCIHSDTHNFGGGRYHRAHFTGEKTEPGLRNLPDLLSGVVSAGEMWTELG